MSVSTRTHLTKPGDLRRDLFQLLHQLHPLVRPFHRATLRRGCAVNEQWSHKVVIVQANQIETLELQLLALGSVGWEVCGIAAVDPTIGLNSIVVTLKRPALSPPPAAGPAAWHPDPLGRYELRYWDGCRWTDHVSTAGVHEQDFPNVR